MQGKINVLVIGSGGREHTLVWKIAQSNYVNKIYCAPGNAGISQIAECVNIPVNDFQSLKELAIEKNISLTVVGPEQPLADGIVDFFRSAGLRIIGPTKSAALLESSKAYAKMFMKKYNIPTAKFVIFDNYENAVRFLDDSGQAFNGIVIKADGLCAGKGVVVCDNIDEAKYTLDEFMIKKKFSSAGERIIIEEKLIGEEASLMAFTDGETIIPMIPSQDHKRVYDNDLGPNTGGMGAYAPTPVISEENFCKAKKEIFDNFLSGIKSENLNFKGIIYAGIMVTDAGPKVLEFNVRFGDPETQAVLPLLQTDIMEIFEATLEKKLYKLKLQWANKSAVCVVMASKGYPDEYTKGKKIFGLEQLKNKENTFVFHAGTSLDTCTGEFVTSGGRVLGVTGIGSGLKEAIEITYDAVKKISFDGAHYRKDIGLKGLKYLEKCYTKPPA